MATHLLSDHESVHCVAAISPLHLLYPAKEAQKQEEEEEEEAKAAVVDGREPVSERVARAVELPDHERGSEEGDGIEEAILK